MDKWSPFFPRGTFQTTGALRHAHKGRAKPRHVGEPKHLDLLNSTCREVIAVRSCGARKNITSCQTSCTMLGQALA